MSEPSGGVPRSGLRNPAAAARGVGVGALGGEVLVLLLAIVPLVRIGGPFRGVAIGLVVALAVTAGSLIGVLRRRWAWWAGAAVPVGLIAGGWLHWSLAVLGGLFALLWAYVLYVRRSVTGGSPNG